MRFTPSIFGKLLEPIRRRRFETLVARHAGDAYVKSFPSWHYLLAPRYAQRSLERGGTPARWCARPCRIRTGGDPVAIFAETFSLLAANWIGRHDATARRW
jgi:hypothetical protein